MKLFSLVIIFFVGNQSFGFGNRNYSLVADELSRVCYQFGFSQIGFQKAEALLKDQPKMYYNFILRGFFEKDQYKCHDPNATYMYPDLIKRIVKHQTKGNSQVQFQFGGLFHLQNWLLSDTGNNKVFQYEDARGPAEVMTRIGLTSNLMPISVGTNVNDVLSHIQKLRKAGRQSVFLGVHLKNDCCTIAPIPSIFRKSGALDENDVYAKVESYTYLLMYNLLNKSELPIIGMEFGNEVQNGFWSDFDANSNYNLPPSRLDRTKKVFQAAKKGIRTAYRQLGYSQDPLFTVHITPDISAKFADVQRNLNNFLSDSYVGEYLFDTVHFSFYPSSWPNRTPIDQARFVRDLGDQTNLPWAISEMGFSNDYAPGGGPYLWNNFLNVNDCVKNIGVSCSSLADLQSKYLKKSLELFSTSSRYYGAYYLAPEEAIGSNNNGTHAWPTDCYRMGLFSFKNIVNSDGVGESPAPLLPAAFEFKNHIQSMIKPRIYSSGRSCTNGICTVWFNGTNFSASSKIFLTDAAGNVLSNYYAKDYIFVNSSNISIVLSKLDSDALLKSGVTFNIMSLREFVSLETAATFLN